MAGALLYAGHHGRFADKALDVRKASWQAVTAAAEANNNCFLLGGQQDLHKGERSSLVFTSIDIK
jgi:hypothetical protein